jgi:hypothetical protein
MKKESKALLKECPPENVFWLCTGVTLKNMKELVSNLKEMDDGVFSYHVNNDKNDFANWIKDVFKNAKLADKLKGIVKRKEYLKVIESSFK